MLITKNYVDSSSSATNIRLTSQTIADSVVAGDAVSYNGSQWVKSNNCVGVYEGNNTVVLKGAITLSGLTAGSFYYCTLNGSLVTSRTEAFNDTKVGYTISSTVMLVDIDREVTAPYTGDLGIFGGGTQGSSSHQSEIEYINISSPSNAANYGTLTRTRAYTTANSNGANQRACFAGSYSATSTDIDYVSLTVASNAVLFGQLSNDRYNMGSCSNNTNNRGVFGPGNTEATILDYITISTLSNSQSFGNLSVARSTVQLLLVMVLIIAVFGPVLIVLKLAVMLLIILRSQPPEQLPILVICNMVDTIKLVHLTILTNVVLLRVLTTGLVLLGYLRI